MLSHADAQVDATVAELYRTYRPQIVRYLTRLVHNSEIAEELCQDTFMKAWSAWSQHDPQASPQGWLFRIAANTAYSYLRRARLIRFQQLNDEGAAPLLAVPVDAVVANRAAIAETMTTLCADDQHLLLLALHAGYRSSELARHLDCSEQAVRLRLFRARARFRTAYSNSVGIEGLGSRS